MAMTRGILILVFAISIAFFGKAHAQDSWVQIEARPSLSDAEDRARAYAAVFPNVSGYALSTGWYAIVLGPFSEAEALQQMQLLKGENLIPRDSYIADTRRFARRFWPIGAQPVTTAPERPGLADVIEEAAPELPLITENPAVPYETPRQARASEAALLPEERRLIQTALAWFGFYTAGIDGAFGRGTRRSMSDWQAANGFETTGVLTTGQREFLLAAYRDELSALGLEIVRDERAGIEMQIPLQLVEFDHYEPPFVHFTEKDRSGVRVLMISQQGDQDTLYGLYDIMQTLEIVPLDGERERRRSSFTLSGQSDELHSYTQARLEGGLIKGFTLVWKPQDTARMEKVLEAMKSSFAAFGDRALPDLIDEPTAEQRAGLLSGLEVRRPEMSRSGFYIDAAGAVLTTTEVLGQCERITLDGEVEADVTLADAGLGIAVLTPRTDLAPAAYAAFQTATPRVNSEVAVSGFSYEDVLDTPVMTFGKLADLRGLSGEENLTRLELSTLPGDAGGPVFDTTGSVLGMLLPKPAGNGRVLPGDVGFAVDAGVIVSTLAARDVTLTPSDASGAMAAEDLTRLARDMTVLVSCWN